MQLLLFVILCALSPSALGQVYSSLWGERGERYDPNGRLPDFSYAGYGFGDAVIPARKPATSVADFGARPHDGLDDTEAFKQAIAATESGVIEIPPGLYRISDIIWIEKPSLVLRGAGSGETIVHIDRTLEDVRPNMGATTEGKATSNYSWSGGFFWVRGGYEPTQRVAVTQPARRGDRTLVVDDAAVFTVGQRVLIEQVDSDDHTLMQHLYSDDPGDTRMLKGNLKPMLVARIISVEANSITLNRPLRWDVHTEWSPTIRSFVPRVHDVGIESLTISFDPVPYGGHFSELGRNAIAFNATSDCWIRDVKIKDCDSAVFFTGVQGTIDGLRVVSTREPHRGTQGHHGVTMGLDNLLTNFVFETHFIHDITMTRLSAGNVVKNGSGVNLSLDHHKRANHANLYCNLDAGNGSDLWRCGGGASLGKHAGAWTTFWGIKTDQPVAWPRNSFGPSMMNLVGLHTQQAQAISEQGKWFEVIDPDQLEPRDLHRAQLERRQERSD